MKNCVESFKVKKEIKKWNDYIYAIYNTNKSGGYTIATGSSLNNFSGVARTKDWSSTESLFLFCKKLLEEKPNESNYSRYFKVSSKSARNLPESFDGDYVILPQESATINVSITKTEEALMFSFSISDAFLFKQDQNGLTYVTNSNFYVASRLKFDLSAGTLIYRDSDTAIRNKGTANLVISPATSKSRIAVKLGISGSYDVNAETENEFASMGIPVKTFDAPTASDRIADDDFKSEHHIINGCIEGILAANSTHYYNLEPGAMYMLMTNCHLKNTGAYRGSHTYLIAAHGKQGASTTAQGVGHHVQIGAMGTTGLTLTHSTYVAEDGAGSTFYASRIGLGSCTTQCRVKYSLFKVMGSDDDFDMY